MSHTARSDTFTQPKAFTRSPDDMPAAFPDLRSFLDKLDREGELSRVETEVDWHHELGAISRRALDIRAPALLFQSIKGYAPERGRVLANIFGRSKTSHGRFALALGLPSDTPITDLIAEFARLSTL